MSKVGNQGGLVVLICLPRTAALGPKPQSAAKAAFNILIGWVVGEKHIPAETFGGRGHSVLLAWDGLTSNCQDWKRGTDFPGQSLWVLHIGDGGEFHPPVWCVQLAGLLIQPYFSVPDRRLRWVIPPASNVWIGYGHLWGTYCFLPSGKWGNTISIFQVYSKRMSPGTLQGLSLGSGSTSGSQKVTFLSVLCLLGDIRCLSKDWLCGWLLLWMQDWGIGHSLCTDIAPQCHIPMCGQSPVSTDEPLWPFGGSHHVGLPSSWA